MSSRARRKAEIVIGPLYKRMEGVELGSCFYCGDSRQVLDHVPPIMLAAEMDLDEFRKKGGRLVLVPSCILCNHTLGAKKLSDPYERMAYLLIAYDRKVEKLYRSWDDEAIAELGPNLGAIVRQRKAAAYEYIDKLRKVEAMILRGREKVAA